jgi:hypothetical protein
MVKDTSLHKSNIEQEGYMQNNPLLAFPSIPYKEQTHYEVDET